MKLKASDYGTRMSRLEQWIVIWAASTNRRERRRLAAFFAAWAEWPEDSQ
jgi:hypothetical protein